jgi:hypothetical protein
MKIRKNLKFINDLARKKKSLLLFLFFILIFSIKSYGQNTTKSLPSGFYLESSVFGNYQEQNAANDEEGEYGEPEIVGEKNRLELYGSVFSGAFGLGAEETKSDYLTNFSGKERHEKEIIADVTLKSFFEYLNFALSYKKRTIEYSWISDIASKNVTYDEVLTTPYEFGLYFSLFGEIGEVFASQGDYIYSFHLELNEVVLIDDEYQGTLNTTGIQKRHQGIFGLDTTKSFNWGYVVKRTIYKEAEGKVSTKSPTEDTYYSVNVWLGPFGLKGSYMKHEIEIEGEYSIETIVATSSAMLVLEPFYLEAYIGSRKVQRELDRSGRFSQVTEDIFFEQENTITGFVAGVSYYF